MAMTIEQLMNKVGAPNAIALQDELDKYGLTVEDCENNPQYQDDLKAEFSSGLAVVNNSTVVTQADTQEAPIAPAPKKKGRMTKAQKIEAQQAATQTASANALSLLKTETDRQIENTRQQAEAIEDLTDGVATYIGGGILGIESSIVQKVGAIVDEAGDDCRVDYAGITRRAVDNALSQLV